MATPKRLAIVLLLIASATVLSWYLGTGGGGHPMKANLAISAAVIFIALFKVRVIMREFMEVGLAPAWVRRTSDAWLVLIFAALFVVDYSVRAFA
jgi:Prokaryotic Cytochrome C oxidase subunit IV